MHVMREYNAKLRRICSFFITEFQVQIRDLRPKKLPSTQFHPN